MSRIERHVYIKLEDAHANEAGRAAVVQETLRVLPGVAGVRGVRVGTPADARSEASWDLFIIVSFDAVEDIEPYIQDGAHRAYVDDFLKPRLACLKAWNFEVQG